MLDVLVRDPVELEEELPCLHIALDKLSPGFLEMLLLLGVHLLEFLGVLGLRLLYLMEGPQFLVFHSP